MLNANGKTATAQEPRNRVGKGSRSNTLEKLY